MSVSVSLCRCLWLCLGVWVSGCLGVWVSGCLGAWVCLVRADECGGVQAASAECRDSLSQVWHHRDPLCRRRSRQPGAWFRAQTDAACRSSCCAVVGKRERCGVGKKEKGGTEGLERREGGKEGRRGGGEEGGGTCCVMLCSCLLEECVRWGRGADGGGQLSSAGGLQVRTVPRMRFLAVEFAVYALQSTAITPTDRRLWTSYAFAMQCWALTRAVCDA
eukprot:2682665-Rhodomonas_salina.2